MRWLARRRHTSDTELRLAVAGVVGLAWGLGVRVSDRLADLHRCWRRGQLALLVVVLLAAPALADDKPLKGVALVVGQSAYEQLGVLPNPANDARAIDRLLTDLGFDVVTVTDADQKRLSRALRRFAEDADGADVALFYYSGHGIEAAGENFLVPVDAGILSLEEAETRLVPVSQFVTELQKAVPVTILLLDACRSNPFPAGSVLAMDKGEAPAPVAASGLGAPRGAAPLATAKEAPEGLGAVIGYAAAPGHVALDGDVGANSPYAAALLKHLAAGGFAFGDVMTMVGEEVYLKTGARQSPWTNSSLRRTLYFGAAAESTEGDDAAIRGERRKLLLTMTRVGEPERKQVAATARESGVPMDALFAMLNAIGADVPTDPDQLGRLLGEQSERLKALIAERDVLKSADPEIARLSALAGNAVMEGALQTALSFHERAKQRVAALADTVENAEADLKAKRIEFAKVFAESAETYALSFKHAQAAEDFGKAYEQVARWDADLALRYKVGEAKALSDLGYYSGDNAALERSVAAYRAATAALSPEVDGARWADVQSGLATALWNLGERDTGVTKYEEAAAILRAALDRRDRDADPKGWALTSGDLAFVLMAQGARERGSERLEEAIVHLDAAISASSRETDPLGWARLENRLGYALTLTAQRQLALAPLEKAVEAFRAALEERRQDIVPLDWAQTTNNLAIALATIGEREASPDKLQESADLYRAALAVQTRERAPLLWAETQSNLGTTLFALGGRKEGTASYEEASAAFRLALEEITRERSPMKWAALQDNLGLVQSNIGERSKDPAILREAFAAFDLALSERTRERVPLDWASSQNNLGNAYYRLGDQQGDVASLEKAISAFRMALEERTRERVPLDWARTRNNIGNALYSIGMIEKSGPRLRQAAAEYAASLEVRSREDDPMGWARSQNNIGQTLLEAGRLDHDKDALAEAKTAIEAARAVFSEAGQAQYDEYFSASLMQIEIAVMEIDIAEKMKTATP